jgi:hypothetical protein
MADEIGMIVGSLKPMRFVLTVCGILALACWPLVCMGDAPRQAKPKPTVVLNAGTQADADAALAVVEKYLALWEQRKHEQACALVAEPVRAQFAERMKKRGIELKRIDDLRLFERKGVLVARVHASIAPWPDRKDLESQGIGIDMVFRDGKWWVTAR